MFRYSKEASVLFLLVWIYGCITLITLKTFLMKKNFVICITEPSKNVAWNLSTYKFKNYVISMSLRLRCLYSDVVTNYVNYFGGSAFTLCALLFCALTNPRCVLNVINETNCWCLDLYFSFC